MLNWTRDLSARKWIVYFSLIFWIFTHLMKMNLEV